MSHRDEPSIGPHEMRVLKAGGSDRARHWAQISDRWNLAHHNLSRATVDASRAMSRLRDVLPRRQTEAE